MNSTDSEGGAFLKIALVSIHGLIRGKDLELGRNADTGGQTKYVVELLRELSNCPDVDSVVLFTRLIEDEDYSEDYAQAEEQIADGARIVRLKAGPDGYIRKEELYPHLEEFSQAMLEWFEANDWRPDVVHGHYADAARSAMLVARELDVPFLFTGHSLGRNKRKVLLDAGEDEAEIEQRYNFSERISIEEEALREAKLVIASTNYEIETGYEHYDASPAANYRVVPPGINLEQFLPYYYDEEPGYTRSEEQMQAAHRMRHEIGRFLTQPDKPMILAISRPDRRKNIPGLVEAYGRDKELRELANLVVFAGVRRNIEQMDDNEREVLTELLLLMDRHDLYGRMALPKKHDQDTDIPELYRMAAWKRGVFVNPALVENFGLTLIEENLDWYLLNGRLSTQRARTVTSYINRLLPRLRTHASDLVEAFGYSPEMIGAPIGTGAERKRQDEARDYYRVQRASGTEPTLEKHLPRGSVTDPESITD